MPHEIELKARLDDSRPAEQRLSRLGTVCRSYKKTDSYWFPAQAGTGEASIPPSGVRVRRESGTEADGTAYESVLVTYKHKEISDGIEVNDEREFTVSAPSGETSSSEDAGASLFEDLLARLGLYKGISKEKQGRSWTIPPQTTGQSGAMQRPILAELSLVTGLGWFVEIEIIAEDDKPQTVEESRKRLLALLKDLEIPADRIESKPYTVMLREKK
jgi:adenylate cyclase class 2